MTKNMFPHQEEVWLATRPGAMDDRTLRLFACHCARQVWHDLSYPSRRAVDVAEAFADGRATVDELSLAHESAYEDGRAGEPGVAIWATSTDAAEAAWQTANRAVWHLTFGADDHRVRMSVWESYAEWIRQHASPENV